MYFFYGCGKGKEILKKLTRRPLTNQEMTTQYNQNSTSKIITDQLQNKGIDVILC